MKPLVTVYFISLLPWFLEHISEKTNSTCQKSFIHPNKGKYKKKVMEVVTLP